MANYKMNPAIKQKISETKKKLYLEGKIKSWNKGKRETRPEVIDKLRKSHLGQPSWNKGKRGLQKHTEEWKSNMSSRMKNRVISEETRKKLSIGRIGIKMSNEHKKNISLGKKGKHTKGHILSEETIIYPTNTTYTSTSQNLNYTVTGSHVDKCWYSLDGGVTNSTPLSSCLNQTGLTATEGLNTWIVWSNSTFGALNSTTVFFTVDLPPTITIVQPSIVDQDLVFNVSINATDTQGISKIYYSIDSRANVTYTANITEYASAGGHIIRAYANDTIGSWISATFSFTTIDHSSISLCSGGQVLLANGTCVLYNQSSSGGTSTNINTCRYKKLAYYNPHLSWIKQINCL